jgi:hypothetical protein
MSVTMMLHQRKHPEKPRAAFWLKSAEMSPAEGRRLVGKKFRGQSEVRGILAQFRASGLTQRAFAKQEGVSLSSLSYWLHKERLEQELGGDTALVAVTEEPSTTVSTDGFVLELGELRIEVPRNVTAEEWRRLRDAWAS